MGRHVDYMTVERKTVEVAAWVRLLPVAVFWLLFFVAPQHEDLAGIESVKVIVFAVVPVYTICGIMMIRSLFEQKISLARHCYFLLTYFSILTAGFSIMYWEYGYKPNFNTTLTRLDAFYFTIGTFTTAGTGNIVGSSEIIRAVQSLQMLLDLAFVSFAVTVVVSRFATLSRGSNSSPSSR